MKKLRKTLILVSLALAAVAFTAPVAAQADQLGVDGIPLELEQKVELNSSNFSMLARNDPGEPVYECEKVHMSSEVEENGFEYGPVRLGGVSFSALKCMVQTKDAVTGIELNGGVGVINGRLEFIYTPEAKCVTEEPITVEYKYESSVLEVPGQTVLTSCGAWVISASFQMTKENGTPVEIVPYF